MDQAKNTTSLSGLVDRLAKPTANNALRVLKMVLGDGCAEFNLPRSRGRAGPIVSAK